MVALHGSGFHRGPAVVIPTILARPLSSVVGHRPCRRRSPKQVMKTARVVPHTHPRAPISTSSIVFHGHRRVGWRINSVVEYPFTVLGSALSKLSATAPAPH